MELISINNRGTKYQQMPWPYLQSTRHLSLLLPLTTARMYAHVYARLGAPAAHTPSAATRVPTQTPPGLCGVVWSQRVRFQLAVLGYLRTIQENWVMAVEKKEVEIPETSPISRCDHGSKSCRSQKTGSSTDTSNGQTDLISGGSTYKYDQIHRKPLK